MKKIIRLAILIAIIGVGAYMYINNYSKDDIYDIAISQIKENVGKNAVIIDVRTSEEYAEKHAEDAINIPLLDIQNGIKPDVPLDGIIYVYCKTGIRAKEAKAILEKDGFNNVINLTSLDNWEKIGGKVTTDN
ncbi:MAG TPA: rhodanese-like domain-containing protein [Candidatus Saccharibacteria bacterium]|nr:rhodanese-like domain-containing protein [Candidatus Saccharibacteria bacterium]